MATVTSQATGSSIAPAVGLPFPPPLQPQLGAAAVVAPQIPIPAPVNSSLQQQPNNAAAAAAAAAAGMTTAAVVVNASGDDGGRDVGEEEEEVARWENCAAVKAFDAEMEEILRTTGQRVVFLDSIRRPPHEPPTWLPTREYLLTIPRVFLDTEANKFYEAFALKLSKVGCDDVGGNGGGVSLRMTNTASSYEGQKHVKGAITKVNREVKDCHWPKALGMAVALTKTSFEDSFWYADTDDADEMGHISKAFSRIWKRILARPDAELGIDPHTRAAIAALLQRFNEALESCGHPPFDWDEKAPRKPRKPKSDRPLNVI